jgi:hypothetical protein
VVGEIHNGLGQDLHTMKRMWVIVGIVVLSLAAAACSGGSDQGAKSGGAPPAGNQGPSEHQGRPSSWIGMTPPATTAGRSTAWCSGARFRRSLC